MQSGKIHFYNTKTHTRTCKDPRRSPDPDADLPISPVHRSLDLELNLTCDQSLGKNNMDDHDHHHLSNLNSGGSGKQKRNSSGGIRRCPSWLAFEMDHKQEMVARVCMRCHMLVMLCRSSPACPNCKFMHPPDQNPPTLFKSRCRFFC
ncbi:hypothetical protein FEM48_Zijuj06G0114900 [Ziziphus jujuba var. spinosa]|uniref:Uncharacterized protein n=1 Tax=Ziziphus jujuba var. spinosa TaxID=714518 RepID=A0A978V912_ZIZJJ|nr:hypothetical protein FEM48_Zijuj06G0114900 [Ziziphus jujuba var. spinosa]